MRVFVPVFSLKVLTFTLIGPVYVMSPSLNPCLQSMKFDLHIGLGLRLALKATSHLTPDNENWEKRRGTSVTKNYPSKQQMSTLSFWRPTYEVTKRIVTKATMLIAVLWLSVYTWIIFSVLATMIFLMESFKNDFVLWKFYIVYYIAPWVRVIVFIISCKFWRTCTHIWSA